METPSPTRHLLICATHRTGSNLLEEYLRASAMAGHPREFYSLDLARDYSRRMQLPDPDKDFLAYHRSIMERWTSDNGVFAAKIMWLHLEAIQERLKAAPGGAEFVGETPWESVEKLHPKPLVIHVTRKDKVRQAISMVRAKQTGVYSTVHLGTGRKREAPVGEYDFHAVHYHIQKLKAEDAAWVELFRQHQVPVQTVVFEDFIKDPQNLTIALLKALGFPEPAEWHWPQAKTRSQSDAINAEWYARYKEDEKNAEALVHERREQQHRARKALEKQQAREARWARWQTHALGRMLIGIERLWVRDQGPVELVKSRAQGIKRPTS